MAAPSIKFFLPIVPLVYCCTTPGVIYYDALANKEG